MAGNEMAGSPLLEVGDLTVAYGDRARGDHIAINQLNLAIHPGEIVGLLGESGCGKSTLALAMLGLLPESARLLSGTLSFRGRNLQGLKQKDWERIRGAEISLIPQDPSLALCPVLRIGKQVADVVQAHRPLKRRESNAEAMRLLERVHLPDAERMFSSYPFQLSGGQLQRVVIAQAIASNSALIIADEPTSALDTVVRAEILDLLEDIVRQEHSAMLLISHEPEILARLANRILVMHEGTIIEEGNFAHLRNQPVMPFTQELMGAMRT